MKPIKQHIVPILTVCVAVLLCGCSGWLDYTPKDKETEDQAFANKKGFYTAVNGVYNRLTSSVMYGKNLTYGMLDLMGQRYEIPSSMSYSGGTGSTTANYVSGYSYTETGFSTILQGIWDEAYSTILNINVILDNAETRRGTVLNETDYNVVKGDLLALRAFLHFDLLRLFGPVYSRKPDGEGIPYNNTRTAQAYDRLSARDVIYNRLLPDLEQAEACLKASDPVLTEGPLASSSDDGNYLRYRQLRLNYYATVLLKARVYLWAGDKEKALAESRKVIDAEKMKEFFPFVDPNKLLGNTANPDRTFSTEILFGFYNKDRNNIYTNSFDASNLSSSALLQPRSGFVPTLFVNTADYRYQSWWTTTSQSNSFLKYKGVTVSGSQNDLSTVPFYAYFMPLMHLSEAYYIAAEASLDAGNLEEARNYMDVIMAARGRTPLDESITASAMLAEIKNEYMREMWGEGQTFYLFKRFYQKIASDMNANSGTTTVNASEKVYVLPLPASELTNR